MMELLGLMSGLVDALDGPLAKRASIIGWSTPVISFGDLRDADIATVGLNPSSGEFVDGNGIELEGSSRRLHTQRSLGLSDWREAEVRHIERILDATHDYFSNNPYDRWFGRLDEVLAGLGRSYYGRGAGVCHLDLTPFATARKWGELTISQRALLLGATPTFLATVLAISPIRVLILNGRSVVDSFQRISGLSLNRQAKPEWALPRKSGRDVVGVAFSGTISKLGGVDFGRQIEVLGFNHNLQSSFGVTREVVSGIRDWVRGCKVATNE